MSTRLVPMTEEQCVLVEAVLEEMMRHNLREPASKFMRLALDWRFANDITDPLPDNVLAFRPVGEEHSVRV